MYITYGVLASAFGLVSLFLGNAFTLSEIINNGRLDYYLPCRARFCSIPFRVA